MKSLLLILFIFQVTGLELPPISISSGETLDLDIAIEINKNALIDKIGQSMPQEITRLIDSDFISTIGTEIFLAISDSNSVSTIRHLKWQITITQTLGTLIVYDFIAEISSTNIHLVTKSVRFDQQIPPVYDIKTVCTKTGGRRYFFAGPREKECNTYSAQRGLNIDEIQQISNALIQKNQEYQLQIV